MRSTRSRTRKSETSTPAASRGFGQKATQLVELTADPGGLWANSYEATLMEDRRPTLPPGDAPARRDGARSIAPIARETKPFHARATSRVRALTMTPSSGAAPKCVPTKHGARKPVPQRQLRPDAPRMH